MGAVVYRSGKIILSYTWQEAAMVHNRLADQTAERADDPSSYYGEFVDDIKFFPREKTPCFPLLTEEGESSRFLLSPFATGVKASQMAKPVQTKK